MHFSPAECSAAPIGLIATELELHALARARRTSAEAPAVPAAGVCATELDEAHESAPLPMRAASARNARASVAVEPAQTGPRSS